PWNSWLSQLTRRSRSPSRARTTSADFRASATGSRSTPGGTTNSQMVLLSPSHAPGGSTAIFGGSFGLVVVRNSRRNPLVLRDLKTSFTAVLQILVKARACNTGVKLV